MEDEKPEPVDPIEEKRKSKKMGFYMRILGKGGRSQGATPLLGAGRAGEMAGGIQSAASKAAVSAAKQQMLPALGASKTGLAATLGAFFSSPAGIVASIVAVAAFAGAALMYFNERSSARHQYSAQFSAASHEYDVSGAGVSGPGEIPEPTMAEEPYQPVEAGELPPEAEYPPGAEASPEQGIPAAAAPEAAPGSKLAGEFAQQFGKAGGLGSAAQGAFAMPPGKELSPAKQLPNNSPRAGTKVNLGKLNAMRLPAKGPGRGARGGKGGGGGTKKAWMQSAKVKTAMESAAASGGEAGVAQAAATWDGGSGSGGAGGGAGGSGGSSSGSGQGPSSPGVPAAGVSAGGMGGGPMEPPLVGDPLTKDMDNPIKPLSQEVMIAMISGAVAVGMLFLAWKAFQAAPEGISKALAFAAVALALAAVVAAILVIAANAASLFGLKQSVEGWECIGGALALVAGVIGCFAGNPWVALGLGVLVPLGISLVSPQVQSLFSGL